MAITLAGLSYQASGVNIDAGNDLVRRIAPAVARTRRPELLSGLGGFAALASLPAGYRDPVLALGADGVGTKLLLAIEHGRHESVGQDLVAMCVNDVLVVGAEPFLFLDYYATGALDVEVAAAVITGIARGCEIAGCALAGGETAELPGLHRPGGYELAGFCVGVAERQDVLTGEAVAAGDMLVGIESSGPHANGYSLIRRVLAGLPPATAARWLDELLAPTRIYSDAWRAVKRVAKSAGHITGGGFVENVPRMFGTHLAAHIDLSAWRRPALFDFLQRTGGIDQLEMLRVFNNGIGFVVCVAEADVERACANLRDVNETAHVIGRIAKSGSAAASGRLVVSADGATIT